MEDSEKYSNAERRDFDRLKVDFSIIYQIDKPWYVRVLIGGEEVEATALDLSEGGMAISVNCDIPVSTALLIKIMIYKVDKENNFKFYKTIEIQGEVRSNVFLNTTMYRIGISFTKIDEEEKKELIDFAKINKKEENQ